MATMLRGVPVQYEPKLTNRFIVEFPDELDIPSWLVQSASRPSIEIEGIETGYMNGYHYVRKKVKYSEFDLTFIDPIGPSTSQKIMEWVRLHTEITGRMGYAAGYAKTIILSVLDSTGIAIESWKYYDCQITKVDWEEMSYDGGELIKPKVSLQPFQVEQLF